MKKKKKQPVEERTCGNCRYWLEKEADNGFCRRYPPKPDSNGYNFYFPETCPTEWCGEWADRDDRPLEEVAKEIIG